MKRLIFLGLMVCLLVAGLLVPASGISAAPVEGVTGAWWSIDGDGSNQKLLLSGSAENMHAVYLDDGATLCGCDPKGNLYPMIGLGTASFDGNVLSIDMSYWCLSRPRTFWGSISEWNFDYNSSTDTLWQEPQPDVTWYRMGTN